MFPSHFKFDKVIHLFQKEDIQSIGNYHSLSLLHMANLWAVVSDLRPCTISNKTTQFYTYHNLIIMATRNIILCYGRFAKVVWIVSFFHAFSVWRWINRHKFKKLCWPVFTIRLNLWAYSNYIYIYMYIYIYIYVKMSLKQNGHIATNGFVLPLVRQCYKTQ